LGTNYLVLYISIDDIIIFQFSTNRLLLISIFKLNTLKLLYIDIVIYQWCEWDRIGNFLRGSSPSMCSKIRETLNLKSSPLQNYSEARCTHERSWAPNSAPINKSCWAPAGAALLVHCSFLTILSLKIWACRMGLSFWWTGWISSLTYIRSYPAHWHP
jgi:hypothetical protein